MRKSKTTTVDSPVSDSANAALRQFSKLYVALASQLPAVQLVLLEGMPPELQLCTILEADPQNDFPEYQRVYHAEAEARHAVPDAPIGFRVINRIKNHSRDFGSGLPQDTQTLFRR